MLELYFTPGTCALASLIALEETGAPYRLVPVDFRNQQQRSAAYLAINPKGRVPVLVTEDGPITETPAILAYLAQRFPDAGLAPASPYGFARVQELNSYLCSTVHPAHAHRVRGNRWADDAAAIAEMARKAPFVLADCFELIETQIYAGPWVLGEYSLSDPYLYTIAGWLEGDGIDIERFPKVSDHVRRMNERGAVQRALKAAADSTAQHD